MVGLNRGLDDIHGRILSHCLLLFVKEVFVLVRREESQRPVMLNEASFGRVGFH